MMFLFWLIIWHDEDGKSSTIRFRVPGQFWLCMRTFSASRRMHRNPHLAVEW